MGGCGSVHVPRTREDRASEQPGGEGSLASVITATGTSTETTEGAQDELRRRSQRGALPHYPQPSALSPAAGSNCRPGPGRAPLPSSQPERCPGGRAPEQIPPLLHTHLANPLTALPGIHNSAVPRHDFSRGPGASLAT